MMNSSFLFAIVDASGRPSHWPSSHGLRYCRSCFEGLFCCLAASSRFFCCFLRRPACGSASSFCASFAFLLHTSALALSATTFARALLGRGLPCALGFALASFG